MGRGGCVWSWGSELGVPYRWVTWDARAARRPGITTPSVAIAYCSVCGLCVCREREWSGLARGGELIEWIGLDRRGRGRAQIKRRSENGGRHPLTNV